MLGGSIASAVVLGAPDVAVLTLTELADQVRAHHPGPRTSARSSMPTTGTATPLNVMRTVRELEDAGASGMTIEDTQLPGRFGSAGREELIPIDEMTAKLRAAVEARREPGDRHPRPHPRDQRHRPRRRPSSGSPPTRPTGVDAVFLMGIREEAQLAAVRGRTPLPFMLGSTPESLTNEVLATYGVKVVLRGHGTFTQTVRTVYESLAHQAAGGASADRAAREPDAAMTAIATASADFAGWRDAFLGG